MSEDSLAELRRELSRINHAIVDLLCERGHLVTRVQHLKEQQGIPDFVPEREQEMLRELLAHNRGPFPDETIRHLFMEIFRASVALMEERRRSARLVSRSQSRDDLQIRIGDQTVGGPDATVIAGPCAVESEEQLDLVARALSDLGVRFLRGGAFKPRTSPYSFQGLGEEGLKILQRAGRRYGLVTVTEVTDTRAVELVSSYADVLQVGARNMHSYELLREVGRSAKPVLLKRGFAATIEELMWAAEYIVSEGNEQVILCERGIRTFERQTRSTLDISAVALLRQATFLPVIVDLSHSAGRKDIVVPLGRAALAAGASGLMVEVHPCPAVARSDAQQQLDIAELTGFLHDLGLAQRG